MRTRLLSLIACAAALALGTGSALADGTDPAYPGSVLHVTVTGPLVQGKGFTINATGTNLPDETGGDYVLNIFVMDTDTGLTGCPVAEGTMDDIWTNNLNDVKFLTPNPLGEGSAGPFDISFPASVSPKYAGPLIVCAYSQFADTDDSAWAQADFTLKPAKGGGGTGTTGATGPTGPTGGGKGGGAGGGRVAKPRAVVRPSVTQSGKRLRCTRGSWSGRPTSFHYKWVVVHASGVASRTRSLAVTPGMRGHQVECSVTARSAKGTTTATSRPFKVR